MYQNNKRLETIEDLATLLGLKSGILSYLARTVNNFYVKEEIIKSDGRIRVLYKPHGELKKVQKLIHLKWLQYRSSHQLIHSYQKKKSHITNAEVHIGNQYMINLDIQDFYPSVNKEKVYNVFKRLNCSDSVAKLLCRLTTYKNQLPQGAPTSPTIANQVLIPIAKRINGVCFLAGLDASIFSDDSTVSGSKRALKLKNLLVRIISEEGFSINVGKIKVSKPGDKKIVTGVVVNQKLNIDKAYYRKLRAILHNYGQKGPSSQFKKNTLKGMINHVKKFNPERAAKLLHKLNTTCWEG